MQDTQFRACADPQPVGCLQFSFEFRGISPLCNREEDRGSGGSRGTFFKGFEHLFNPLCFQRYFLVRRIRKVPQKGSPKAGLFLQPIGTFFQGTKVPLIKYSWRRHW